MGKLSELKGVEKPVTEWLSKMGWTFKSFLCAIGGAIIVLAIYRMVTSRRNITG